MPLYRIDPKTRRLIVSDLTPSHRQRTTGVHGVGSGTILSSKDLNNYKDEQEEKHFFSDSLLKSLLSVILDSDWTDADIEEINWEEIASYSIPQIDGSIIPLDYAKWTASGLEGKTYQELVNDISGVIKATDVEVSELSTATYDDVQNYINFYGHRSLLTGGAITDNGDGTVAIASLTGWCPISDSETAVGKFFNYAGGNTPSLTDMTTNYIYLDYNGGTLQLVVSTSILTHGFKLDHIHVGTAFRDGAEIHFHKPTNFELDLGAKVDLHHQEETFVHRVDGLITTETGARNLSITAGVSYEGLNRHTSLPFNTSRSGTADFNEANKLHDAGGDFSVNDVGKSVHNTTDDTYGTITAFVDSTELTLAGDTFPLGNENYEIDFWTYHYYDGDLGPAAWVEVHGATQISNSQYNDTDTGLESFTANRYGVSWVFMEIDGLHIHVVYGQGDYKVNEAEEAGVPSSLPNIVTNYCALIAKIILRQGQTTMIITYPWTTVFTSTLATDHSSLGNLGNDDHTQYILHSLADAANDFLVASGNDAFVKKTLAETLALISPLTTRGDMMFMNASVNTRLAKGNDNEILAMGADDPEWKTPATILSDIGAQPVDADLTSIALLGTAADKMLYTTNTDVWAEAAITAAGRSMVGAANAAAQLLLMTTAIKAELDLLDLAGMTAGELLVATGAASAAWQSSGVKLTAPDISGIVTAASLLTMPAFTLGGFITAGANALVISAKATNDNYLRLDAYATDTGSREIASMRGAIDPYFGLGGSQEAKFYNSGLIEIGAFTLGGKLTAGANEIEGSNFDINGGTIDGVTITAPVLDGTVTNTGAALVLPAHSSGSITMVGAATVDGIDISAGLVALTTKGDLMGYSTVPARLGIGTDTHVLTADSGEALGVKWAAAAGGGATIATGTYTGNDGNNRQITTGFKCSLVILYSPWSTKVLAVMMPDGGAEVATAVFGMTGGSGLHATDGFVVYHTTDFINEDTIVTPYWAISE